FLSDYERETLDGAAQESLISLISRTRKELAAERQQARRKAAGLPNGIDFESLAREQRTRDEAAENDRICEQKRRIRLYGTE
ncbi:MAG: hypothetical protein WAX33_04730, partial [Rectinemataceae bacterium]